MIGQSHRPLFVEHGTLSQHAVQCAAELVDQPGIDAAIDPAGEVAAGDAVADGKAGDGIADRDDVTGAVAQRHDALARWQRIGAAKDQCVAAIERGGPHSHHDLMRFRFRPRLVAHRQGFGSIKPFKTVAAHAALLKTM